MYTIQDLLGTLYQDAGVALYLSEGKSPILAIPSGQPHPSSTSVSLCAIEGPTLSQENLETIVKELGVKGNLQNSGSAGIGEFRYRNGPFDIDIFFFENNGRFRVELRKALPDQPPVI